MIASSRPQQSALSECELCLMYEPAKIDLRASAIKKLRLAKLNYNFFTYFFLRVINCPHKGNKSINNNESSFRLDFTSTRP